MEKYNYSEDPIYTQEDVDNAIKNAVISCMRVVSEVRCKTSYDVVIDELERIEEKLGGMVMFEKPIDVMDQQQKYIERVESKIEFDSETQPVMEFIDLAEHLENTYPFLYVEIARTRSTEWMAWLCTHNRETNPNREVIVSAQGLTSSEACKKALQEYQAKHGGE